MYKNYKVQNISHLRICDTCLQFVFCSYSIVLDVALIIVPGI